MDTQEKVQLEQRTKVELEKREKHIFNLTELNQIETIELGRDAPEFAYLLHQNLSQMKGEFIFLPALPTQPKGFHYRVARLFLVTAQRFEMWRLLTKEKDGNGQKGCLLIGPRGVGKSVFAYFLACYAYINRYFLIYIPHMAQWTQIHSGKYDDAAAKYFIDQFLLFCQDLVDARLEMFGDFLLLSREMKWYEAQIELMQVLGKQKDLPVYYIFDEHQCLSETTTTPDGKDMTYGETVYFRPYMGWDSTTSGFKTIQCFVVLQIPNFKLEYQAEKKAKFIMCSHRKKMSFARKCDCKENLLSKWKS